MSDCPFQVGDTIQLKGGATKVLLTATDTNSFMGFYDDKIKGEMREMSMWSHVDWDNWELVNPKKDLTDIEAAIWPSTKETMTSFSKDLDNEQEVETLRDKFAMAALGSIITCFTVPDKKTIPELSQYYSASAYVIADAMMEARKK